MRRQFLDLIKRFGSDERGVFMVVFGVMAIVVIAIAGAVVDYVSLEQARTRAQVALDSAALALQGRIYDRTEEQIRAAAELLVRERTGAIEGGGAPSGALQLSLDVTEADATLATGTLLLRSEMTIATVFVALVGVDTLSAEVVSEATRRQLNLEVAFVLDNSRSMLDEDRMDHLIEAATCGANVLLNSDCESEEDDTTNRNTSIAIVPFTMLVNVGTNNANAAWLDRTGNNGTAITNDNFDNDDNDSTAMTGAIDRIALFDQMTNVDWGGCVEARISPYDTNDAPPVPGTATMFTPLFAPDEPSNNNAYSNSYIADTSATCLPVPRYTWTQTKFSCDRQGTTQSTYDAAVCSGGASPTNVYQTIFPNGTITTVTSTRPTVVYNNTDSNGSFTDTYTYVSGSGSNITNRRVRTWTYEVYSLRELQERICKYTGATATNLSQASARGPNSDCPFNPIMPLTSDKGTIMDAIDELEPQGGTNIHAGAEWGFRVLSPGEPFTQGKAYEQSTAKIMIIMTDGANTAYQTNNMNNTTFYSHYGFPWNARMGTATSTDAQLETEMNNRLEQTCANAKAAGIVIYTIGLSVDLTTDPETNEEMLTNCASTPDEEVPQYAFFPDDPEQLVDIFEAIALQLADLRLSQ